MIGKASPTLQHRLQWYISLNGQQKGPVSAEQVAELALKRRLLLTDHVWREGMAEWSQLQYVEELMGIVRRMRTPSRRPPGPATASRPPLAGPHGYRAYQPPAAQPQYSPHSAPKQSLRPQPVERQDPAPSQSIGPQPTPSQNTPAHQGFQPGSLYSYRSPLPQSQQPPPAGPAPDQRLNAYNSQGIARRARSPSLPQVAPAAFAPSTPSPAAESVHLPRLDPYAEARVRTSSMPRRPSERPFAWTSTALAQTTSAAHAARATPGALRAGLRSTSVPTTATAAPGSSRTSVFLSALGALLVVGLAGTLAFFLLRPDQLAIVATYTPFREAAAEPSSAAASPIAPTPPIAEQRPDETPEETEPKGEREGANERSQTSVVDLDNTRQGATARTLRTRRAVRTGARRVRTGALAPADKRGMPTEKTGTPAAKSAPESEGVTDLLAPEKPADEDKTSSKTATERVDRLAKPLKKSGAAETPAKTAPGAETAKPAVRKPNPNRSIDDLLDYAISNLPEGKSAKSKRARAASRRKTAASTGRTKKRATSGRTDAPSRNQVLAAIRRILPVAKSCAPSGSGTARSQITISGATGKVVKVAVRDVDVAVGRCVEDALRRARFPKFARPTFNITYPIRF